MDTLSGRETVKRIKNGLDSSDFASTTKLIELIRDLSRGIDETGVDQLADLISGEVGFTTRVIKAAQPMRYNPEGVQVETITQAIQLVGLDRVRNVSISLLMGEDKRHGQARDISSEASTIALANGIMSRIAAEKASYSDPNLCFISGLLQNYGLILTSKFLPDQFLQFRKIEQRNGTEEAHATIFGISQLELAREILKIQRLPSSLLRSLRLPSRSEINNAAPPLEIQPLLAGSFAREAGFVLSKPILTRNSFETNISQTLGKYAKSISFDLDDIKSALVEINEEFKEFRILGSANGFSDPIVDRTAILANDGEDEPPVTIIGKIIEKERAGEISYDENGQVQPSLHKSRVLYAQSIRSLTELADNRESSAQEVGQQGLDTALTLHKAELAFLFLLNPDSNEFHCQAALGNDAPGVSSIGTLPYNGRNLYSLCINNGQNIFLEKPSASTMAQTFPGWMKRISHREPFIFTPLYFVDSKLGFMLFVGGGAYTYMEYKTSSNVTIKYAQVLAHLILKKQNEESALKIESASTAAS